MDFGGRYRVAAGRDAVWTALNDTEILAACIPGCKRIDWVSESALELEVAVNLGVAHPTFKGDLLLSDVLPAHRYTLTGQGRGGLLGKAQASADISLADLGSDTLLSFKATGGASGQMMKLGRALIGSSAQKIIDGFFERFGEAMGAEVTPIEG
ncbi:carbon monoxide dehydrogenase subunit G [Pelagibacterium sp. 26DY04]|uniref:CoxG family protein n=1 Tax=Pelagibacterium sp. 26DY04 TaxID=2967130 RepID=UPI002815395B|nr:carbon monoxide dehydrogenase subunit G [Pelagibacterium sp. 26DY04]WMT87408.1 carbon monoxide dehydrogenase subunit G [Pelagibacterium sp. 26DY04]